MVVFPNCKINLGLFVTGKRMDGYHDIETILYPVELCDILEIVPAPGEEFRFTSSGIKIIGSKENNLVYKAYLMMKNKYDLPAVNIHLHKIIPPGSGLGGGSADAAFTIKMLNNLFELGLSADDMIDQAKILGSDCAFFIKNKPVFAFGKGDEFEYIEIDLEKFFIVIVKPEVHIGTSDAYSWIKPLKKESELRKFIKAPVTKWKELIYNDFEVESGNRYPVINDVIAKLYNLGAVYASLTGSGAAVYGIFDREIDVTVKFQDCFIWTNKKVHSSNY